MARDCGGSTGSPIACCDEGGDDQNADHEVANWRANMARTLVGAGFGSRFGPSRCRRPLRLPCSDLRDGT